MELLYADTLLKVFRVQTSVCFRAKQQTKVCTLNCLHLRTFANFFASFAVGFDLVSLRLFKLFSDFVGYLNQLLRIVEHPDGGNPLRASLNASCNVADRQSAKRHDRKRG